MPAWTIFVLGSVMRISLSFGGVGVFVLCGQVSFYFVFRRAWFSTAQSAPVSARQACLKKYHSRRRLWGHKKHGSKAILYPNHRQPIIRQRHPRPVARKTKYITFIQNCKMSASRFNRAPRKNSSQCRLGRHLSLVSCFWNRSWFVDQAHRPRGMVVDNPHILKVKKPHHRNYKKRS